MNNKFFDYLLPIGGGAGGSLLGLITLEGIISVVVFSFIGATIGYFVKYLWDWLFKKYKEK